MTVEIALVFTIIAAALYLFASEKLPLDITAILILITLIAIPLLFHSQWLLDRGVDLQAAFPTVREGLSGLSSTATVTVLAMFILSAGIQRSGLIHVLGQRLFPMVGRSELRMILIIAALVGLISGFINNTAAVAVAIPLMLDMARRLKMQASRLLMPVSFFGMLGGTLTLIGTSTNILASAILADHEDFGRQIGMFEFTHLGLIVLGVGLIYFVTVGRWLMPKKDLIRLGDDEDRFIIELGVPPDSPLVDQTLEEYRFAVKASVRVLKLVRGETVHIKRAEEIRVRPDDIIQAHAELRQVMDLIKSDLVEVLSVSGESSRVRGDGKLVRVLLRESRLFEDKEVRSAKFWKRYQARLIGLEKDALEERRIADEPLEVGGIALLEVSRTALARLRDTEDLMILEESQDEFNRRRMWIAGGIMAAVVLGATLTPLPIVVTALMGVVAMVATGSIDREGMYASVSWPVIFLLAGVIPLGIAMTKSGAADLLAGLLAVQAGGWHPILVLMALYLVTTLLTELVSNNASVVILVPVAISLGHILQIDIFALVLAVMFAASTSFLSPIGYQTNTMIFGTGLYRFTDFAKVGAPLNLLLMVVTSVSIWWLWIV
ncbi:SLC13 family permease [Thioalkalivibrio sp.]|uniref:SLC13 family permease n=1 Tax=Thioalkalivibrio sp. TaxID=2093813 RepID=UPI0012D61154|nr:SLC13 family permease [Thioalkalivibrio sp.]TVP83129.1 MAG: citrate transporter [Thioalkalivibrio sp.]